MTERIEDQISAFIDDELSAEECAFFVRRLDHDPVARDRLVRYAKIGSTLRGELLSPDPDVLRRRLQHAMSGVSAPPMRSSTLGRGLRSTLLKSAMGFGIAAAVAVVAVLALRMVTQDGLDAGALSADQPLQADERADAPSYVVPQDVEARRLVSPPTRLTNYLIRHSEYANPVRRTSFHSDLVGTADPDIAAAGEEVAE